MRSLRHRSVAALLGVLAACAAPPPPLPPPGPPPPPPPPPPPELVWTARAEVSLRSESTAVALPRALMRLQVVGADSTRLEVRCVVCPDSVGGWVERSEVVAHPVSPDSAATGTLAEFALAVRFAAAYRDLDALLPVMADEFSFALTGEQNPAAAFTVWQWESFRSLDQVPRLLDQGLAALGHDLWVAPPEHAHDPGYGGLRLGFRRTPSGRWEWVFLVRGGG